MKRSYEQIILNHFAMDDLMLFLAGPRQVGKTTTVQAAGQQVGECYYLNWDDIDDRKLILAGPRAIIDYVGTVFTADRIIIILDELHKYIDWKNFLKGFYDSYKSKVSIIVTGSARLDIYKAGSDSLLGRYFLYRMHPLTVAECLDDSLHPNEIREPRSINQEIWQNLWTYGGFPKPFLKADQSFSRRWQRSRQQLLLQEDVRDLSKIHDISRLNLLAAMLKEQAGQLLNYSNLANKIRVSVDTIRRWVATLESLYYCFLIRPWSRNVTRSLLKEPKVYMWDWADLADEGARFENLIGSHLLKAVHMWTDLGMGDYQLFFVRNLEKREVDFLVTKNNTPWFLVECKLSNNSGISRNLRYFQDQTGAQHAFQVTFSLDYVQKNCFSVEQPIIVPAKTFLSQLV